MLSCGILFLLLFKLELVKSLMIHKLKPSDSLKVILIPTCEPKTFCEHAPNYPTDLVLNELEKNPHLRDYANVDEMDSPPQVYNEPEEEPLCVSTEQIVLPKSGLTKDSNWKFIVNHENITQSVRIETCMEEDKPCRVIEGFAEGYYSKCKQKYIYRQLLSITDNGTIDRDSFRFPASCCCHVEFQADRFLFKLVNSRN